MNEQGQGMQQTIELFHFQHSRALQCAGKIESILQANEAVSKAQDIRLLLAQLAGILKPHLTSEDRMLYPTLMKGDAKASLTALRFSEEMRGITPVVLAFLENWRKPGEIEVHALRFAGEATSIFAKLRERIESEERVLYPLVMAPITHGFDKS